VLSLTLRALPLHDTTRLATSVDTGPDITPCAVVTEKDYDSKSNRVACRKRGIMEAIPHRSTPKDKPKFFQSGYIKGTPGSSRPSAN
jgi:hypothetical protein